jgi:photosystem II stability/assembly factor-like uncharacterized protein
MKTLSIWLALVSIFLSPNGLGQWVQTNNPPGSSIGCFAVVGTKLFTGGDGVFLSTDNGASWTPVDSGLTNTYVSALAYSPNGSGGPNLFAGTDVEVFRSTDDGKSWKVILDGVDRVHGLAVAGPNLLAGLSNGIFLSTNNGTSWAPADSGLPFPSWATRFLVTGSELFAVTAALGQGTPDLIYRSTDNGLSWSLASQGLPIAPYMGIYALGAVPTSRLTKETTLLAEVDFFLGCPNCLRGLYMSTDNGSIWKAVDSTMKDITSFAVVPTTRDPEGTSLFAGTSGRGVIESTDGGVNWTPVNAGLRDTIVRYLGRGPVVAGGPYLLALTQDNGIWKRPLSELITEIASKQPMPSHFMLDQNYPNPFNPKTVVNSQLPVASNVKLIVYDVLGREVAVLVNERRAAGSYRDTFDGSGLASGVYFYRLQAGSFVDTKKLLLIR